ncbi:B-cell receptor CD22-like isoform X2 [Salarias fasciatus]|uniref:B-cell receptor CD22-like n=1 Tax=Salarias fasciatus TaxID=181472 RepID=A0A672G2C2_SALFA|nr:B-cell receptor CD22-like isoform X2 [Salarias fasciatus]
MRKNGDQPVDLQTEAQFAGRVTYESDKNHHNLTIKDLRESDSAEFSFMFTTNQPGGGAAGSPGVTLTVTALQVVVTKPSPRLYPSWAELKCWSRCNLPTDHFVWYKNGRKIYENQFEVRQYFKYEDSMSCARKSYEKFPSPSVCILRPNCNRVTYSDRAICALSGQTVDISCSYSSRDHVVSLFWFKPNPRLQLDPDDLNNDPQYAGRIEVLEPERGRSVLRINELKESDSAEYQFKFKTKGFEWRSSLPGTTLTVTALQVEVTRIIMVHQSHTEAELMCRSSCGPAGHLSFVWFKNGKKILTQQTSTYTDNFYPGDVVSCTFQGHEDNCSPSVYPSKLPALFVSPSGEIVEGGSVTLTCRIDGDPAVTTTLSKDNRTLLLGPAGTHNFTSISSNDRGLYHCRSQDQHSVYLFIDVQYAPKLPLVSVSFSGGIVEGSSVSLTCSSDANPVANYTWHKEEEELPKASGEIFTITDFRPEHSGGYYCEAQNSRGRRKSTVHRLSVASSWKLPVALSITAVFLGFVLLFLILWFRRERSSKQQSERSEAIRQEDDLQYASVQFTVKREDPVYSNFNPTQLHRQEEENVVYATPRCSSAPGTSCEDASALYGNVNKGFRE